MESRIYVEEIIKKEWKMFDAVKNIGGRASCQDNYPVFRTMRAAQFQAWDDVTLESYLDDLEQAEAVGRNLLSEKYAFMMENTDPCMYEQVKAMLPVLTDRQENLIRKIVQIYLAQSEEFMEQYPNMSNHTRDIRTAEGKTEYFASIETYICGELKTYSEKTLQRFLTHLQNLQESGQKYVYLVFENTAKLCGYENVDAMNRKM